MICHSVLAAKSVERESKRDFMPLPGDPESINADKDRLRLGGRSDESSRMLSPSFRHSDESQSLSMPVNSICHSELVNKEIDSGSEAGMTNLSHVYQPCHPELDSGSINAYRNNLRSIGRSDQLSRKAAFTMAEVLITLGIIGIVAAMTLPTVINRAQRKILTQQFKKSYATVQNAINLAQSEWGAPYECYWLKKSANAGYYLDQCSAFWDAFLKNVKVIQKCDGDDYDCHPKYKTKAEVLAEGGEVLNPSCSIDFPYANFYILNDGTYIIINNNNPGTSHHQIYFAIDINGSKGPNKWGYDLYYLTLNREDMKKDVIIANEVCAMKEKDGMYINEMLLE